MKKKILGLGLVLMLTVTTGCSMNKNGTMSNSTIHYEHSSEYSVGAGKTEATISNLYIDWVSGEVTVQYGDVSEIEFYEEVNKEIKEEIQMRYLADGDTLRIQFCKDGNWDFNNVVKKLFVTLPNEYRLTDLSINSVSADVSIDPLTVESLYLDTVSGDSNIDGMKISKLKIDNVSGNVTMNSPGYIDTVSVETVSGNVKLNGEITKSIDADTTSGNIVLGLLNCAGFTAEVDAVSGDFASDFPTTKKKDVYHFGDDSLMINLDSVSGDLSVCQVEN